MHDLFDVVNSNILVFEIVFNIMNFLDLILSLRLQDLIVIFNFANFDNFDNYYLSLYIYYSHYDLML